MPGLDPNKPHGNYATIRLVPGKTAPRATEWVPDPHRGTFEQLLLKEVVITEQATKENLPCVDFVMEDRDGKILLLSLNGRVVNTISAAVRGVNMRVHGVEEP